MGKLEGCRALVTGGGSGIGAATCRRMHAEGASVAVVDIDADTAKQVAAEIDGLAYGVDVTDYDALESACQDAAAQMGGLTTLFNNAGSSSMSAVHEWDLAEWERIVRLNLSGVFHGFRRRGAAPARHRRAGRGALDRVDVVDQRHPPRRGRGALRRREGCRRLAERHRRARVRPRHPRERGRPRA